MKTKNSNPVVKRTISLSPLVNQWAEEMAAAHGFESNFSSFLADLVRRAHDLEATPPAETQTLPTILVPKTLAEAKRKLSPRAAAGKKKAHCA